MTRFVPYCYCCANILDVKYNNPICKAFPNGIPKEIWDNKVDHRKAYEGDSSIQFIPKDEDGAEYIKLTFDK